LAKQLRAASFEPRAVSFGLLALSFEHEQHKTNTSLPSPYKKKKKFLEA
jgi:hypothetical protein